MRLSLLEKQIVERNLRYLVIEMFWAAIFTGCVSFNAAYMIRLGGSNLLISLLTSGAALINALATMPFAALLERTARRKPLIIGSLAILRLGHLALIAIPWLSGWHAETMLLILLLLNVPVALFAAAGRDHPAPAPRAGFFQPQYHARHHGHDLHFLVWQLA